jgi:hypothetical protein
MSRAGPPGRDLGIGHASLSCALRISADSFLLLHFCVSYEHAAGLLILVAVL